MGAQLSSQLNAYEINAQEFDRVCAKATAMPRRHRSVSAWEAEHERTAARKAIFDAVDGKQSDARGYIDAD